MTCWLTFCQEGSFQWDEGDRQRLYGPAVEAQAWLLFDDCLGWSEMASVKREEGLEVLWLHLEELQGRGP